MLLQNTTEDCGWEAFLPKIYDFFACSYPSIFFFHVFVQSLFWTLVVFQQPQGWSVWTALDHCNMQRNLIFSLILSDDHIYPLNRPERIGLLRTANNEICYLWKQMWGEFVSWTHAQRSSGCKRRMLSSQKMFAGLHTVEELHIMALYQTCTLCRSGTEEL